ncbi:4Fe-4S dicluster domain-containing protein [Arabiibacter massiliensis]|uniref:4Fe-4S dicluster domain-containing protein n=1 Tax=Arabiibacter massiliensis TaxID=1870985 RepID=UPI0009BB6DF9|nr:4Fe-4S dicluster domain-containing protein [Arabiibacter massiliensis]
MAAHQYGFFVDTTRCVKCYACEVACQQWHGMRAGTWMRRTVHESCTGTFPHVERTFTSLSCMHCENPACTAVCPVQAVTKREEDGLVVVDKGICIGCRSCALACPFDVPRYGAKKVMDKCDGCLGLGRKPDEEPRCVATCPTRALRFGRLEDMAALAAAKGGQRMEGDTAPSVYVARRNQPAPAALDEGKDVS